jgi:hypothetical protein
MKTASGRLNPLSSTSASSATALRAARLALERARAAVVSGNEHRSLHRLELTPAIVVEVLLMAVVPCAALWWLRPTLMGAWYDIIGWWAPRLHMALAHTSADAGAAVLAELAAEPASFMPTPAIGMTTTVLVILAWVATYWLNDRALPLKYVVRVLCAIQASALLYFLAVPAQFPYTVAGHLESTLSAGYSVMLTLPVLLALGWGVLRLPLRQKVVYPLFLLGYFALMLPHKALLHVLILQQYSVLFMPVLYLCFGAVFDLMIFVALYSWLASRVPVAALSGPPAP